MKKMFFLVILAILVMTVFSGCTRISIPTIGVAVYKYDDTFMSYTRNTIEKTAQGKAIISAVDSRNSQILQNEQVDNFIAMKMNAIAINPVERTEAGAIVDKAKAENIPVVFFNREPYQEDMEKWDCVYYVGAKAEESGTMQGEILAEYWKAYPEMDRNNDGILQYVMLKGEPGHQDTELRTEYSIRALREAGIEVEELASADAYWDRPRAVQEMDKFIDLFGDRIEAVICNNDDMALGVIESLRKTGYFTDSKYIPVVGVDATIPALYAISEGTLLGTVLNDGQNQGKATFDIAYALGTGAAPTSSAGSMDGKYCWVPYQKVTKDNYTQYQ